MLLSMIEKISCNEGVSRVVHVNNIMPFSPGLRPNLAADNPPVNSLILK
jgi:hypothetical protein